MIGEKMNEITLKVLDAVDVKVIGPKEPVWKILSYEVETYFLGEKTTFWKSHFSRRTRKFPTGLLPIVSRKLKKDGYKVYIEKPNFKELPIDEDIPNITVTLEDYQKSVIEKVRRNHRGIILSPTASGKTVMEAAIIDLYNLPKTLIIVPNRDLLYQTAKEMKRLLSVPMPGIYGDGKEEIFPITVATFQTLVRRQLGKIDKFFDLILIDEIHVGRCASYQMILNRLPSIHYRYGFTGTMRIKQPDRYIIQGLTGPVIAMVPAEKTSKRVTDIKLYMVKYNGKLHWHPMYHERVINNIWLNEERNSLIADIAKFLCKDRKMSCLILVEKIQQAAQIKKLIEKRNIKCPMIYNKTPNEKREEYKTMLDNKAIHCVVATSAISVGSNIPNLESIIIGSEIKDWVNLTQKLGRGRRKTKQKNVLIAVDIFSDFGSKDRNFRKQSFKKANIYKKKGWLRGVYDFNRFKEEVSGSFF